MCDAVVGVVHEGVILFGDVLLRLPEMVKKVRLLIMQTEGERETEKENKKGRWSEG